MRLRIMLCLPGLGVGLWFISSVAAAPPAVTSIAPPGAERGKAVEVLVQGANLTPATKLIVPFKAEIKPLPAAKPVPNQLRYQIIVDPATPVGFYPVRLFDETGVSGLAWFAVDPFPNVLEVEDNSTFEKAQQVPFPCVVNGSCGGGDVDYYRFEVKKGQRVVVETEAARLGSGVVPQIRVTDAKGRFVAADDTQRFKGDCRVGFSAPADGAYVVEFSDTRYRGGNPPDYRLKVGDYDAPEELFPLGRKRGESTGFTLRGGNLLADIDLAKPMQFKPQSGGLHPDVLMLDVMGSLKPGLSAPSVFLGSYPEMIYQADPKQPRGLAIRPPVTINGRFAKREDIHRWQLAVKEDQRWRFKVEAEALGSYLDGVLKLTDQDGKQLATADDSDLPPTAPGQPPTKSADPLLDFAVPKGVTNLGVELRDGQNRGGVNFGYRLTMEPAEFDFMLQQPAAELNVPRGGWAVVNVPITRRGYTGPIQLVMSGVPAGWSVAGGYVPEGGASGQFTIQHVNPALGISGPLAWRIEGTSRNDKSEKGIVRYAESVLVLSKDGNIAGSTIRIGYLTVGLAEVDPFTLKSPAQVDLVNGYSLPLPITVAWPMKALANVEVVGLVPTNQGKPEPKAALVKPGTATMDKNQATLTLTAPINANEGRTFDVIPQGRAKVNNKDVTVVGPAIAVVVKAPFKLELAELPPLTPGQSFTWKGKIQRHALFKEAVALKVDGLPAGVAMATPVQTILANQNDWQVEFKVDAKTAPAMAKVAVTATATINGMAYSQGPVVVGLNVIGKK